MNKQEEQPSCDKQGEPVGTVGELFDDRIIWKRELDRDLLVYTAPSQSEARGLSQQRTWVGLTEGEIVGCATGLIVGGMDFARAIETKLVEDFATAKEREGLVRIIKANIADELEACAALIESYGTWENTEVLCQAIRARIDTNQ